MSRIAEVTHTDQLALGGAEVLAMAEKAGAPDPRMVRVLARADAGVSFLHYWTTALYNGLLPHRLKEIVRIFLSASNGCAYCSQVRSSQGAAEGINNELLIGLDDIDANPLLSEPEKCALRFAQHMKAGSADSDEVFADLGLQFSEEQIIELGMFCGIVLGMGSFAKLLHVTTWEEACSVDPAMVKIRNLSGL